ncbi:MAG: hypothetical protein ACR2JB_24620 [Bryobacteraceae bacterium]
MFRRIRVFGKLYWAIATLWAGFLMGAGPSLATTMTSTTFSTWTAGLTGTPTELDFSPIVPGKSYSTSTGIALKAIGNALIGFNVTGPDNGVYKLTGLSYGTHNIQSLQAGTDSTAVMNVATPAAGNNAIFLGLATTNNSPVTLTLSDGQSFSSITTAFFGLSISHPITWLTLTTTNGSAVILDDFYYGASNLAQESATSEGATMAMCGAGLLILFGAVRRKNTRRLM